MILHVEVHACLDAAVVVLPLVLEDVEEVAQEIVVVNAMALAAALAVMAAQVAVLVETYSQYIDEREQSTLERWNGKEHNVHRHERLPIGL